LFANQSLFSNIGFKHIESKIENGLVTVIAAKLPLIVCQAIEHSRFLFYLTRITKIIQTFLILGLMALNRLYLI